MINTLLLLLWLLLFIADVIVSSGHFCPALSKAVKTMKKAEKAVLTVKPQCKCVSFQLQS